MSSVDKVSTLAMKVSPDVMEKAGEIHYADGYDWADGAGYASAIVGGSDSLLLFDAWRSWLIGWCRAFAHDQKKDPPPFVLAVRDYRRGQIRG